MGIDTLVRDPIVRSPIDLFHDPRYSEWVDDSTCSESLTVSSSSPRIPRLVTMQLAQNDGDLQPGTQVLITSFGADVASVWVLVPGPRCLGQITGTAGPMYAAACKQTVGSIPGIVTSVNVSESGVMCEVRSGVS